MPEDVRLKKLKWLCRRGMKELDILLERFLAENERAILEGHWPELEGLLETEDDILWDWFQNPEAVASDPYGKLLEEINRVTG